MWNACKNAYIWSWSIEHLMLGYVFMILSNAGFSFLSSLGAEETCNASLKWILFLRERHIAAFTKKSLQQQFECRKLNKDFLSWCFAIMRLMMLKFSIILICTPPTLRSGCPFLYDLSLSVSVPLEILVSFIISNVEPNRVDSSCLLLLAPSCRRTFHDCTAKATSHQSKIQDIWSHKHDQITTI